MLYAVYLPYHKSDIMPMDAEEYRNLPDYPQEFRRVRRYKNRTEQLNAYANISCAASQLIEAKDEKELMDKVKEMDKNFANEEWLKKNIYPYT